VLHPNQFHVNEAWIAFKVNDTPIRTESDGDYNCLALMDAASCFILTSTLVAANEVEASKMQARRVLKEGRAHKQELPKTLFIPSEQPAHNLALEAERQKVAVVRVPEDQLLVFIGEAREAFKEHFGGGGVQ
jgi:predicted short-subunit dehydrogenase-like oxidoreductase (DUF2520 family)